MTVEAEVYSDKFENKVYQPSQHAQEFVQDMTMAICQVDQCEYKMSLCIHQRLAHELLKAMLESYASQLERNGYSDAAGFLRNEL